MFAHPKILSLLLVINIAAGGVYAFANPNTATDSAAVYQTSMILGYDVTGITFDVHDANPAVIDSITFQVAPRSGSAKVTYVEIQTKKDGPWTVCSLADDALPTRVATCRFDSLSAEDVTALDIVAK